MIGKFNLFNKGNTYFTGIWSHDGTRLAIKIRERVGTLFLETIIHQEQIPTFLWSAKKRENEKEKEKIKSPYVNITRQSDNQPAISPKGIRAAIDRYLKQAPINKPWSFAGDYEFKKANDRLNAVCRNLKKEGKVGAVVQKTPKRTIAKTFFWKWSTGRGRH